MCLMPNAPWPAMQIFMRCASMHSRPDAVFDVGTW